MKPWFSSPAQIGASTYFYPTFPSSRLYMRAFTTLSSSQYSKPLWEYTTDHITFSKSGIGLGLAKLYLAQPNTRVILAARSNTADILDALPKSFPGTLHGIYKLDSASTADAIALRESLVAGENTISKIDIVIANAGISEPLKSVLDSPIDSLEEFYRVNTLGPVRLYQQLWRDLMEKSENPKFILVSSVLGSLAYVDPSPCGGYGASKAAANYFVRKMHLENETLVAVSLHPGCDSFFLYPLGNPRRRNSEKKKKSY